jgi:hypothetical protein
MSFSPHFEAFFISKTKEEKNGIKTSMKPSYVALEYVMLIFVCKLILVFLHLL